jgi:hypothetical protein
MRKVPPRLDRRCRMKGPPRSAATAAAAERAQCNQMCHYYHCYCNPAGPVGGQRARRAGAHTPTEMKISRTQCVRFRRDARAKFFTFVRGEWHFVFMPAGLWNLDDRTGRFCWRTRWKIQRERGCFCKLPLVPSGFYNNYVLDLPVARILAV